MHFPSTSEQSAWSHTPFTESRRRRTGRWRRRHLFVFSGNNSTAEIRETVKEFFKRLDDHKGDHAIDSALVQITKSVGYCVRL